jgi:hypothetical protein
MAYSRWGSSIWYTFWCASNRKNKLPTKKLKYGESFEICDFPSYIITYGDLKTKGLDSVLNDVKSFYSLKHTCNVFKGFVDGVMEFNPGETEPKNITFDDLEELRGYLNEFITDVDKHYSFFNIYNFIKYEWFN